MHLLATAVGVLLISLINSCKGVEESGPTVDEYVEIIENGMNQALNYVLPVDASAYKPTSGDTKSFGAFDYVIIGSGSAGSVIASRLTETKDCHVLVLEAGVQEDDFVDVPAMAPYLVGSQYNWGFNMVPQTNACLGMVNQSCAVPRGKGLGGSSLINAMMYSRGNKEDFDRWAAAGNPGWSYEDVLPLYKKSEHSQIYNGDFGYHGRHGPWNVAYHKPNDNPEVLTFLEANEEDGVNLVDYNGRRELGASFTQMSAIKGQRDSLARAFLLPARKRKNLKISTNSYVVKILINNTTKEAHGVLFSKNNQLYVARARKEVILSAGSISSPQLLMLSGVGPKQHLEDLGIPLVQDLAVGENLQDHPTFYGLNFQSNYSIPSITMEEMVEEYLDGAGWLTVAYGTQSLGFYNLEQQDSPVPEIELINYITNIGGDYIQNVFRYTDETFAAVYGNVNPPNLFAMLVLVLHPEARGRLSLQSSSPYDYPLIDTKLLDDPAGVDLARMLKGVEYAISFMESEAFKKINGTLVDVALPQCAGLEYLSEEYWICNIKHLTGTGFHPVGTCKMGPDPAEGAVVDAQLKVHGIKNLRVADASVIPFLLSGHTNAPAAMIGEHLACLLKGEVCWGV